MTRYNARFYSPEVGQQVHMSRATLSEAVSDALALMHTEPPRVDAEISVWSSPPDALTLLWTAELASGSWTLAVEATA